MRFAGIAAALAMVSMTACMSSDAGRVRSWKGELPIASAFLRERLPPEAVAYARVPNLLGLLSMPKNSQLDAALRSEANITNVANIQKGLVRSVLSLPALSDPRLRFVADAVRSPIEMAGISAPSPAVLIGATLSARSQADFNKLFDELGRAGPAVSLAAPLDGQGIAQLSGLPLPAFAKFEPASGQLLLAAGPALSRAAFEQLLKSLPANVKDHPMFALEQKIDASGQGLFAWVDAARVVPMAAMMAPDVARGLGRAGFGSMRAIAFGMGTANGKGRLSFVLDVGNDRKARPFPVIANEVSATSVGEPDAAVLLSIPSQAEMFRLEGMLLGAIPPAARNAWGQLKSKFEEAIGVKLEDVFAALGPDVVLLFDEVGDYTAVHLRDPELFDALVKRIAAKTGSGPVERKIGGKTFQYWRLPSLFSFMPKSADAEGNRPGKDILAVLGRMQNHVYWYRDGDYLYVAQVPQPLIDRVTAGAKSRVADWLADEQRIDMSTSLFAATGTVEKMPRRTYEMYIGILQALADMTEAEFDVWSMPTAEQLELPEAGALGFSINLGEPYLSLELSYENHPGELFFGGGAVASAAVVGILAAIAIPAYQDYTIRAQVTEGLNLASQVRASVAESYAARGALPRDRRAAGLPPSADATAGQYVESIDVSNGQIRVTYGNAAHAKLRGNTLTMTPYRIAGRDLGWACGYAVIPTGGGSLVPEASLASTTIEPKYLPSACR